METDMRESTQEIPSIDTCESLQAIDIVKDKWSMKIIFLLQSEPLRYLQLKRQAGGITKKMLTQTLRKLEDGRLITRTVHPTSPPTVEYALSPIGEQLLKPLEALFEWGRLYAEQLESADGD